MLDEHKAGLDFTQDEGVVEDGGVSTPETPAAPAPEASVEAPEFEDGDDSTPDEPKVVPADDLNKLKSLFQRREAQLTQALQALQAQQRQRDEELWQIKTANLTPEQKALAQQQRELVEGANMLREYQAQQQSQAQVQEQMAREFVVSQLLEQNKAFGVSKAALERFRSPEDMEAYCDLQKTQHRERQAKARAATGKDSAAAGVPQGQPIKRDWFKEDTRALLSKAFS